MSNNSNTIFEKTFDKYAKLFSNIIINLLQVGIVFILFICIINITRKDNKKENELYPTELNSSYYLSEQYKCDLDDINSNESSFYKKDDIKIINLPNNNPSKSKFTKELIKKGMYIGYETGSLTEILSFLFYYLLFRMEHFLNKLLSGSHVWTQKFFSNPILVFISIIPLMGLMNGFSQAVIFPFLIKLFRMQPNANSGATFFSNIPVHIFITFFCFFSLLFLFLMIPSMFYFMYLLLNTLSKTLSNVINIVCIFLLYMCINSLHLFIKFMETQYGEIAKRTVQLKSNKTLDKDSVKPISTRTGK